MLKKFSTIIVMKIQNYLTTTTHLALEGGIPNFRL